jgi:hypothetical protein
VNVTFYKGKGKPGKVLKDFQGASYTDAAFGSFDVTTKGKISKKAHWVSVQANLAFSSGGEWGWNTNNTARQNNSMWQNPGGGFATGCSTWGDQQTCLGAQGQGPDFSFSLN